MYKLKKNISDYKLFIFDLDGTLYFQKGVRIHMCFNILKHYLKHITKIKDIKIIMQYRKLREDWNNITDSNSSVENMELLQFQMVANLTNSSVEHVQNILDFWMIQKPLTILKKYRDNNLIHILNTLKQKYIVVIFSDYPTNEKLKALEISVAKSYSSNDNNINKLKPNPKGIEIILEEYNINNCDALLIGDRFEKDGKAAIAADIDYLILSNNIRKRKKQLFNLF